MSSRYRAMLFDTSAESVTHVRAVLAKVGVEVVEWATSGTGWLPAFQKAKVDLAIVDYVLPKRDGLYVVEKIHEAAPACGIVLTHSFQGWPANHVELKAYGAGAGAALQKPFADLRLAKVVDKAMALARKNKAPTRVKLPVR